MKLDEFLADKGTSDIAFAKSVEADRTTISRIRRGKQIPSPQVMQRIIAATGGKVLPNDFFDLREQTPVAQTGAA